jgi:hypothetical protein
VNINFEIDSLELDTFATIIISDNGHGICYEELSEKFKKFYESQKSINGDLIRGKNGYGRLTFYKFAQHATWDTVYKKSSENLSYSIKIQSDNLKDYTPTIPNVSHLPTGTIVKFQEVSTEISTPFIDQKLKPYLKAEFAWFLELKEDFKIIINGEELDYSTIIAEQQDFPIEIKDNKGEQEVFSCKYIRWNKKLNEEFSRFYFLNERFDLKHTKTTLLNKKGDDYWHSVIVVNDFFDDMKYDSEENENEAHLKLFDDSADVKIFRKLVDELNEFLKTKRKPFLKKQAEVLVAKYQDEKVFPTFSNNDWDIPRKKALEDLVKEMYEVEPAVFTKLNKEQKRIFLELLNLIMDSSERENLFKIIDAVVDLDSKDREKFAKILEITRLKQVISTIQLIVDRLLMVENLEKIVFNHELKAGEVKHLQKFIEKHYWIFGEEYRLVCAEEVKFQKALQKYIYLLRGVTEKIFVKHPDKYKEMDLFLAGTDFRDGKPHNVIVEIKNPTFIRKLTSKEVTQIKNYIDVILTTDAFNDSSEFWSFYLIGQDYDNIVKKDIQNIETGMLRDDDNHCLYVKKWSEIINEVKRRLKYLLEKLKIERSNLAQQNSLDEIMEEVIDNSAVK